MRSYFTDILGNEDAKSRLFKAITRGTLPHAHIIVGPVGSGKKTMAKAIAAAVNCANIDSDEHSLPCGVCNNCRRIKEDIFPDIKFLGKSNGKATIGVEDTREFREDMFLSATEAAHKFYVIENAESLTSAAQNALLKVLEEPPKNVHIIL